MIKLITNSVDETQELAKVIGNVLRGGEFLELVSDIGGGKTTFVKGLARGLDIDEVVQSPTFTISRLYKARNNLELHHFDFYRLSEGGGVVAAELAESLEQPNAIVAIEWGEIVEGVLPQVRLTIKIKSLNEDQRSIELDIPAQHNYVQQAVLQYKNQRGLA